MKRNRSNTAQFPIATSAAVLMALCALEWFATGGQSRVPSAWGKDAPAGAGDARAAEPSAADEAAAEKTIHELFKAAYAKRDPSERVARAQRFLRESATEANPPLRYVMLREARDLAASAGDYPTAHTAIDRMATA